MASDRFCTRIKTKKIKFKNQVKGKGQQVIRRQTPAILRKPVKLTSIKRLKPLKHIEDDRHSDYGPPLFCKCPKVNLGIKALSNLSRKSEHLQSIKRLNF